VHGVHALGILDYPCPRIPQRLLTYRELDNDVPGKMHLGNLDVICFDCKAMNSVQSVNGQL
jgi:hypothetical protein